MKKNWKMKTLGEVCEKIIGGGTPSKSNPSYWNGSIPWASVKDIKEGKSELLATRDFISEEGLKNSSANLIPAGTLIISTRMGLGRIVKTKIDTAINQDLKAIFPKKEIDSDFLLLCLKNKAQEIIDAGGGTTVSGIRLDYLRSIEIPLPSLEEQKQIVNILNEKFTAIDGFKKIIKEQIADADELKKSYLNEAFAGKL